MKLLVEEKGRSKQIHLPGRVDRHIVKEELDDADAFVLASKYETFGIVYIEALACGLPIITQKNGGSDEIINNDNGILLEDGTIESYASAMKKMLHNRDNYNSSIISLNCHRQYSEDVYVKRIEQLSL